MQALQTENDPLNQELQGYVGTDGTLQTIDSLLAAATTYLETQDITQTAANLESISASVDVDSTSEAFQKLYKTLLGRSCPHSIMRQATMLTAARITRRPSRTCPRQSFTMRPTRMPG